MGEVATCAGSPSTTTRAASARGCASVVCEARETKNPRLPAEAGSLPVAGTVTGAVAAGRALGAVTGAVAAGCALGAVTRGGRTTDLFRASEIPERSVPGTGCTGSGRAPAKAPPGSTIVSLGTLAAEESPGAVSKCT